jgi:phosphatidylserine/phosphatidylglycerophosphate/cardiolipin synthase-like enzyme
MANAVQRGVAVSALIAHTNRAGEVNLRRLETRLLGYGVTVARTADDLVRYHGKLLLIDRQELYLMAFNMTYLDIERSRSFGVATRKRELVREAARLFDADVKRQTYEPASSQFLVSPINARKHLAAFLKAAKKQILIYDPEVSDREMIGILEERAKAGVDVRIIGKVARKGTSLTGRKLAIRLHTRTIIRDGKSVFLGSQSLRELELDARREVGIIFQDPKAVSAILRTFEEDWEMRSEESAPASADLPPVRKLAKKVAKAVAEGLPPVEPVVDEVVKEMGGNGTLAVDAAQVKDVVKEAVKQAVKDAVKDLVESAHAAPEKPNAA